MGGTSAFKSASAIIAVSPGDRPPAWPLRYWTPARTARSWFGERRAGQPQGECRKAEEHDRAARPGFASIMVQPTSRRAGSRPPMTPPNHFIEPTRHCERLSRD